MCIIIYVPANAERPDYQALQSSWTANSDGAGFMYAEAGKLVVKKGFMNMRDFHRAWKKIPDKVAVVAHFRIGTHGPKNAALTHPFTIHDDKLAIVHNGILSILVPDELKDTHSDTSWFAEAVLRELDTNWHKKGAHKFLIESFLGGGNKMVAMDHEGHVEIYNEKAGHWDEGVWYSNYSYRRYVAPTTIYAPSAGWTPPGSAYHGGARSYPLDDNDGYAAWDDWEGGTRVGKGHRHGTFEPNPASTTGQKKIGFDTDATPPAGNTIITPNQDDPDFQKALNAAIFKDGYKKPIAWAEAAEAANLNIISWQDFARAYNRGYINPPEKELRTTEDYAKFREAMAEYWKKPWEERKHDTLARGGLFKGESAR